MAFDSPRHLLDPDEANILIAGHNRVLKLELKPDHVGQIIISHDKITIQLNDNAFGDGASFHPFEILQPNAGTANFRTIQVNAGNLWAYPSPEVVGQDFGGSQVSADVDNFNTNLTVPSSTAVYVYIGYTPAGGWAVKADSTDDGSWIEFGSPDNDHFLIGFIDAVTNAGSQQLIVSQYVNEDVTWPVGGSFQNTLYLGPLVYHGNYNGAATYVYFSSVVHGTVPDGFPAAGKYIYISGGGVGPGSAWLAW